MTEVKISLDTLTDIMGINYLGHENAFVTHPAHLSKIMQDFGFSNYGNTGEFDGNRVKANGALYRVQAVRNYLLKTFSAEKSPARAAFLVAEAEGPQKLRNFLESYLAKTGALNADGTVTVNPSPEDQRKISEDAQSIGKMTLDLLVQHRGGNIKNLADVNKLPPVTGFDETIDRIGVVYLSTALELAQHGSSALLQPRREALAQMMAKAVAAHG